MFMQLVLICFGYSEMNIFYHKLQKPAFAHNINITGIDYNPVDLSVKF